MTIKWITGIVQSASVASIVKQAHPTLYFANNVTSQFTTSVWMTNTSSNLNPTKICSLMTSNAKTAYFANSVAPKRPIKRARGLGLLTFNCAHPVKRNERRKCSA